MRLRFFVVFAIAVFAGVEASAAVRNEVPILVYWSSDQGDTSPFSVEFDDRSVGEIPFSRETDHFRGMRAEQGSWAFHDVSLQYSNQVVPLALRTRAGVPAVTIEVALPALTACKPTQVNSLRQVAESAPVRARIKAMLEARHLLELRANVCPPWAKRDLAEIYFAMNCSLAKGTSFFRVSDEAKERYREFARDRSVVEARIRSCDTQMFGIAAVSLRSAAQVYLQKGDFQEFAAMNADLRASASSPDWRAGLAVQGLDENTLKVDWLNGLYTEQQLAIAEGDFRRAVQANETLRNLVTFSQFKQAFRAVSLDSTRLEADRVYLEVKTKPPEQ